VAILNLIRLRLKNVFSYSKNEIVLGHYNGFWYRAIVLDSDPKGIIVLFIDYGNMALLLMDEILPISNEYYINKLSFEVCSRQFIVDSKPEHHLLIIHAIK